MTTEQKEKYLELMQELADKNISAVMLIQEQKELHYVRNCDDYTTTEIIENLIDTNESVQEEFLKVLEAKAKHELKNSETKKEPKKLDKEYYIDIRNVNDLGLEKLSEMTNISKNEFQHAITFGNTILTVYPNLKFELQTSMACYPPDQFLTIDWLEQLMKFNR